MTIADEAAKLHLEISKLRPDKRRRYPADLRRRIVAWVDRAQATGMIRQRCIEMLGMTQSTRITNWRSKTAKTAKPPVVAEITKHPEEVMALVPVAIDALDSSRLVVVTPGGHRVEGLSFAQVCELMAVLP